jgi:hypothetical protein
MGLWSRGILFVAIIAVMLSGYAFGGEKKIMEFDSYRQYFAKVGDEGEIWIAYYDENSGIHIRNAGTGKDLLVNGGRERVSSGLEFTVVGGHLLAVWREKEGVKRLMLGGSHDNGETISEPVLVDEPENESLPRMVMGSNAKGDVVVNWHGESSPGGKKYHLYAACSRDFGKTFTKPINLTLGYRYSLYPALLVDEKGAYTFSWSTRDKKRYMVFRKTLDGCKTWSDQFEIGQIGDVTLFVKPIRVGGRLHVYWFNSYTDSSSYVIEGAYSDDDGKTWKRAVLEATRGIDAGIVNVAHDSKGHIYIALSGVKNTGEKQTVFLVRSEDNGETWSGLIPVRHYSPKNTKAEKILVRAEEDGTVVAVWIDFRNIRSNIYMQYSKDYGKTWQEKDILLEADPGRFNTAYNPFTMEILKAKERYYLVAHRFRDDTLEQPADMLLFDFTTDGGGKKR